MSPRLPAVHNISAFFQ